MSYRQIMFLDFYSLQNPVFCFVFFFQAEAGIRDIGVTGVPTCALPIWSGRKRRPGRTAPPERVLDPAPVSRREPGPPEQPEQPRRVGSRSAKDRQQAFGLHHQSKEDRKSVGKGKSVDLGGRRALKKKEK